MLITIVIINNIDFMRLFLFGLMKCFDQGGDYFYFRFNYLNRSYFYNNGYGYRESSCFGNLFNDDLIMFIIITFSIIFRRRYRVRLNQIDYRMIECKVT